VPGYTADEISLFDGAGRRKYLTASEAARLLAAASRCDEQSHLFCRLLYHTGCRVSEGLQLTPRRLDPEAGCIVFRTLKRRKTVYRGVPVPHCFLRQMMRFARSRKLGPDDRLFPWCRQTGWRHIRAIADAAGVEGPQATPKGFRHQFGCYGIERGLPESLVGRLLGHSNPKSTRVYTHVMDAEERALVARMW
jgi:integrase/recombinase XerD